jgi:hypothetical protein
MNARASTEQIKGKDDESGLFYASDEIHLGRTAAMIWMQVVGMRMILLEGSI